MRSSSDMVCNLCAAYFWAAYFITIGQMAHIQSRGFNRLQDRCAATNLT